MGVCADTPCNPSLMIISSSQNPRLKLARALLTQSKTRRQEGRFVLEGARLVGDVLAQGYKPDFVLHKPEVTPPSGVEAHAIDADLFDRLSDTQHSQGILAVFSLPSLPLPPNASLLIALDALQDPGNLGTILRTAAAAGVDGALLLEGTADPFNPKVVRAGMGAHFRLPILSMNWKTLANTFQSGWQVICADAHAAQPYTAAVWDSPTILIIGSEAHGLSDQARAHAHDGVFIPMAAEVESLNSASAAAVLLFEIRRQRGNA